MKTFEEVADFHGHSCPGLAMGYRVSMIALREFSGRSVDEELVAIVENNSCAVDAVQVMTGCTFGKGNLVFRDYGKQVYTFIRRPSGESIRIAIDWEKPEETEAEKVLWTRYTEGDRSAEVVGFIHNRKAAKLKKILDADEKDMFRITTDIGLPPPEAEIYESVPCMSCGEKTAEPKIRMKKGKLLCIPCIERKEQ